MRRFPVNTREMRSMTPCLDLAKPWSREAFFSEPNRRLKNPISGVGLSEMNKKMGRIHEETSPSECFDWE